MSGSGVYRFLLRPKWVAGQALVVFLVVLFVNLGFWQLRRLDERRERNATVEAASDAPAAGLDELSSPGDGFGAVQDLEYRRVSAVGTYDAAAEVAVRSRSLEGRPGYYVLTPLVTAEGSAVIVNRGFVPLGGEGSAAARRPARPPDGRVDVTGLVQLTQERGSIGPTDPPGGVLDEVSRVDLARLQRQYGRDLYPVYIQLADQEPAQGSDLPVVLPPPELGEGSHLSYAFQWFAFAAIGAIGWPLLVRRAAREQSGSPISGEGTTPPGRPDPREKGEEAREPVSP